jgi:hypothetical protein
VKSFIVLAALRLLCPLCFESNFCTLLFLTVFLHELNVLDNDDVPLYIKETFAAAANIAQQD